MPTAASSNIDSNNHSQDAVGLNISHLTHIDFDNLMKRVNEVTVSWSYAHPLELDDMNNNDVDSDDSESSDSSSELMRQLVNLSQRQQEEATAVSKPTTLSSTTNTHPTDSDIQQQQESKTKEFGIQADSSYSDAGTMAVNSMSSVGVSTSFGSLNHSMGLDLHRRGSKPEDRGTIFIDLRNQKIEPRKPEKVQY